MKEVVELFPSGDVIENEMVEALQYCKVAHCFVPINSAIVMWQGDKVSCILVKVDEFFPEMDETLWQCGCCGPEGSSRCSHLQTLEYLIEHGIIQLDQAEYPPKPIHHIVDKPVPAAHCPTTTLV